MPRYSRAEDIIKWIDTFQRTHAPVVGSTNKFTGPFTANEIWVALGEPRKGTIFDVLKRLRTLGYIFHQDRAYKGRSWYIKNSTWHLGKVVDSYELYMLTKRVDVSLR